MLGCVCSAAGRAARATNGSESADARRPQAALAEGPAANRCSSWIAGSWGQLRNWQAMAGETPALRSRL